MGFRIQKRVNLGKTTSVDVSKSGLSFTQKICRFVTINSRGYMTLIRFLKLELVIESMSKSILNVSVLSLF